MSGFGVPANQQQRQQGPQGPPQGPVAPAPTPPTAEEKLYLEACGQAILAGSKAATLVADADRSEDFLRLSEGVNQLAMARNAILGKVKGGPGH